MKGVAGPKQGSGRPAAHTIAGKRPSRCKSKVICWQRSAAVPTFADARTVRCIRRGELSRRLVPYAAEMKCRAILG